MRPDNFRTFLFEAFEQRRLKNAAYSMRAFARDIGLTPQNLDKIFQAKSGLSSAAALKIAGKLQMRKDQMERFIALVEVTDRSQAVRSAAERRLAALDVDESFEKVTDEEFDLFGDWMTLACCVLVDLDDFKKDMGWIAARLKISQADAEQAFERLFAAGFLREEADGRWVRDSAKFSAFAGRASPSKRNYYRQLWNVAERSLDEAPVTQRHFAASLISLGEDDLAFAFQEIDSFHRTLISKIAARPGRADRLYGFAAQFFPVDCVEST